MSQACEVAASRYLFGGDEGLAWHSFPFHAWVSTWDITTYNGYAAAASEPDYSASSVQPSIGYDLAQGGLEAWPRPGALDSPAARAYLQARATDSAAAATALSTGSKTTSGSIAASASGLSLVTIAEQARSRLGAAIGVVTTVPFDHATPAAFVSHAASRSSYADIAAQIIGTTRPEAVIGGGHPGWCSAFFSQAELSALKADSGWRLVERQSGVDGAGALEAALAALGPGQGLFGLFGGADGAFEAPSPYNAPGAPAFDEAPENPSLAAAAVAAAELLAGKSPSFFLVVEQGDIDWANHAKSYGRMLGAMHSLDRAVAAIVDFIDRPGDGIDWSNTLLVVTADHATGFLRFPGAASLLQGVLPADASSYYQSSGHSNELVSLSAKGDHAQEAFGPWLGEGRPGSLILDNTAIFRGIAAFLGLDK